MNNELVNKIIDTFDELAMKVYEETNDDEKENVDATDFRHTKLHTNYYECLHQIYSFFSNEHYNIEGISPKVKEQIDKILVDLSEELSNADIERSDILRALLMLDIKGFKNLNFSLDIITPDAVALIFALLLQGCSSKTILDPNFGVGNLAFMVFDNLGDEANLIGFENHELLAKIAADKANVLNIPLSLFFDDCLNYLPTDVDLIISDLAAYDYENQNYNSNLYDLGVRYFPYLVIEHYLHMEKNIKMLFLIENDFFNQNKSLEFRKELESLGHIDMLIALPQDFFLDKSSAKSIIVVSNNKDLVRNTDVYMLPSLKDRAKFQDVIAQIKDNLNI